MTLRQKAIFFWIVSFKKVKNNPELSNQVSVIFIFIIQCFKIQVAMLLLMMQGNHSYNVAGDHVVVSNNAG